SGRLNGVTALTTLATACCAGPGRAPAAPAAVTPASPATTPATILATRPERKPVGSILGRFLHFGSPAACSAGPLTLLPAVTSRSPFSVEKPAVKTSDSKALGLGTGQSTTERTS